MREDQKKAIDMNAELNYKYRGARALVILHAEHMRRFLKTWREFVVSGAALPATDNADYESPQTLLRHVLRASRGYMIWMCQMLEQPDPEIRPTPEADRMRPRPMLTSSIY